MPTFEVQTPDGRTFSVDAADLPTAVKSLDYAIQAPDFDRRAAGMSHQQMVDTYRSGPRDDPFTAYLARRIAAPQPGETPEQAQARAYGKLSDDPGGMGTAGKAAATFLRGVPFVGEYADEALGPVAAMLNGGSPQQNTNAIRQGQESFAEDNPKTAIGLNIAGGVTGSVPMVAAAPAGLWSAGSSLAGRTAAGLGLGSLFGGVEGAVSGYGAGTDSETRAAGAKNRALIGGLVGGGIGAAAPLVMAGGKAASNAALDYFNISRNARQAGLSKPSYDVLSRVMAADDSLTGSGARRIAAAGPDAMVADAGQNAQGLLDVAIQKSGAAGAVARDAVEQRAAGAGKAIAQAMDRTLGRPTGINAAATSISKASSAARKAAYDAAYNAPINYAAPEGRAVEDLLKRIPGRYMGQAVQRANELMQWDGVTNKQIMATIGKDGSVSYREMPNVMQLDYIKRALGELAEGAKDEFGRMKPEGLLPSNAARELRAAIGAAVPEYNQAVKLGGDKIAEDNALRLGSTLFNPSTTREAVRDATAGMTQAERTRVAQGLRTTLDDALANVKRAVTDGNMDAREAIAAVKAFSSRANREKLVNAIGQQNADTLLGEVERATTALSLRSAVATNSKTYARTAMGDVIDSTQNEGIINALKSGEGINAGKRLIQGVFGTTGANKQAANDKMMSEIVTALTKPRGQDAANMVQIIADIARKSPQNAQKAKAIADVIGLTLAGPGYSASTQAIETLRGTRRRQSR